MDTLKIINDTLSKMTKTEYKIALFATSNINDFAFETLEEISKKIGTSTASVIRFCRRLGFEGYKEFQDKLREELKTGPSLPDKFLKAVNSTDSDSLSFRIHTRALDCIKRTFDELSDEILDKAVTAITGARKLLTFGMKESYALAHYAYTRFITVRRDVYLLPVGYNGEIEYLLSLNENDVCIVFLFHRYTKEALLILKRLKERGVRVILVSAAPYDKIAEHSEILIPCYVDVGGIKNSSAAPVVLVDYLCNSAAMKLGDDALEYMRSAELEFKKLDLLSEE